MSESLDLGSAYKEHREGLSAFVAGLDADQLATKLAACDAWTAREVLAHVAGIPQDILAGRLEGVGSDEWTQAQIDLHDGMDVEAIAKGWAESGGQVEAMAAAAPPEMVASLISDLVVHDLDVRNGLGDRTARDTVGARITYDNYANRLGQRLAERGQSVRLIADGDEQIVGAGPVVATVRASRFELLRALTGRRSATQIKAFEWDGDADAVIDVFSTYPMRTTPLSEA